MTNPSSNPSGINFFEAERTFPNDDAHIWYESLKGLEDHKAKLLLELEMLLYPERLEEWSKRHHKGAVLRLCERTRNCVPLILFEGDIGTGKTALAETVGDALARRLNSRPVHLLKMNTQVRGTGQVGEMSDLIVQAFTQAEVRARSLKGEPVLLLLDEADALAASRDVQQMHHEDKAGLNTLLQRLDNLRPTRLPIAALFITNRPEALDTAIRRRAALTLWFERPNEIIRAEIFRSAVPELKLSDTHLAALTRLTGEMEKKNCGVPFTASDLTDRLLPAALRTAFAANRALTAGDLISQAEGLSATPPFGRGNL
jgi:AAA+ superfamily predicted ATPase